MRFLKAIFFVVLLISTNAWAESRLVLSCSDVTNIEVWRLRGEVWQPLPTDGYHYVLVISLTAEAQARMKQVYDSTKKELFLVGDQRHMAKRITIWAGKRRILSDSPIWDNFSGPGPIITKKTKEAAFETARMICPDKAPTIMLTDGS